MNLEADNKVFKYFEEISSIPRASGNTKAISDYCVEFAKSHNMKYYQDEYNNVIIYAEATSGREKDATVIIQGHLDMVAEKTEKSTHCFEKDGLGLVYEGDFISARETTLGADDGIAIAYALAILDSDEISHPPIEAVFTVDEEIGMLGAEKLDMDKVHGKYLLNIDSEEEGIFLAGCAGGITSKCTIKGESIQRSGFVYDIVIDGLKGGHSGTEINKERANAHILMGRLLNEIKKYSDLNIIKINGGTKDNVIPNYCSSSIMLKQNIDLESIKEKIQQNFLNEYKESDAGIKISIVEKGNEDITVGDESFSDKVIAFLMLAPQGIYSRNIEKSDFVETSLNMGSLTVDTSSMIAVYSVRSSIREKKYYLCSLLEKICEVLGGIYSEKGDYPSWEYCGKSKLRDIMVNKYRELFDKTPQVETIHAGVECGYFAERCKDIDIVSFGPDILDIHTVNERMSISSVNRTYRLIVEILKELK